MVRATVWRKARDRGGPLAHTPKLSRPQPRSCRPTAPRPPGVVLQFYPATALQNLSAVDRNTAKQEYGRLRGIGPTPVPVENTGGPGTRDSHWREAVFGNELMTGFVGPAGNPLSRTTVGSLQDLG